MTVRIAVLGDTHIRNLKYHGDYRKVFEKLFVELKRLKPDFIVHVGDLAHSKINLSPEYFDLAGEFLEGLANEAPTWIILGNHDGLLRNMSRMDAVTPVAETLDMPGLHVLKDAQIVYPGHGVALNVLSIFDKDNWQKFPNDDNINISLFHGAVKGIKTEAGFVLDHGEDISIFEGADYAFLGDIHKSNQCIDEDGRIRYCGSTIQQNHAELDDKGFLFWEIQDKENFTCEHIHIPNPAPFITIELTPKGRIPKATCIPQGARLRLASNTTLSFSDLQRVMDVARTKYKPESVAFLNRAISSRGTRNLANSILDEDLRSQKVQEKLIAQYLKEYDLTPERLQLVYKLNEKYNKMLGTEDEVSRNVNWKLKSVEWDNLFNYGKGNKIDFDKLKGIVGIFGKSFSGKSSIVDSFLYTIFNSISKNSRKNLNIVNQNKNWGAGKAEIQIDDKTFLIDRRTDKYQRTLHGETTTEAKTDVDFSSVDAAGIETSLNGESRNDTDKTIRRIFGSMEDFLLTSMASQFGSMDFISEGSTKRKEILAKFLDLEIFDKKFKMAKEDAQELKVALKKYADWNPDEEIEVAKFDFAEVEKKLKLQESDCADIEKDIDGQKKEINILDQKIDSAPTKHIDIEQCRADQVGITSDLLARQEEKDTAEEELAEQRDYLQKAEDFLASTFNVDGYRVKLTQIRQCEKDAIEFERELTSLKTRIESSQKKTKLLEEVPCGPEFSSCKLLKEAYSAKELLAGLLEQQGETSRLADENDQLWEDLEPNKVRSYLGRYDELVSKRTDTQLSISKLETAVATLGGNLAHCSNLLVENEKKIAAYEANKEVIENLGQLKRDKKKKEKELKTLKATLDACNQELLSAHRKHAVLEQQCIDLEKKKKEVREQRQEYEAYDLFLRCMHNNGISYDVITQKLPVLNEEIAKILTNVVKFEVFFENDGKRLNIFIKHPRYSSRPLELCSGAEKTLASLAIRLAMIKVSNLPVSNVFILDEPALALDDELMEGFMLMLDMLRESFETIILISHLSILKDVVDTNIEIEKKKRFAYVCQ